MAGKKPSLAGFNVLEYLKKYPMHSKKNIGKLLYKEHPLLFQSDEHARRMVRYYTHSCGEHDRKCTKDNGGLLMAHQRKDLQTAEWRTTIREAVLERDGVECYGFCNYDSALCSVAVARVSCLEALDVVVIAVYNTHLDSRCFDECVDGV